ncbi:hypothetical protein EW026_g5902 [Hermanssonia centrifuga]|uniref:Uncharacterized protein n=1 Tax=Hermanssonia centrifuga TaxID=98765 RepID=A0A4S4KED8_9APHY|nr:hypothetical protein EW026_g5902 [Hermanssonia centrifuga]
MKVSLTPDRLKSMEVYKQEKKRHKAQENEPAGIDSPDFKRAASSRRARRVDSILEDDEPTLTNEPTTHSSSQTVIVPRARLASLATTPSSIPSTAMNPVRSRSVTISAPLSKKRSNRQMGPPPPPPSINNTFPPKREAPNPNGGIMQNGRPQRTRKIQRSPESLDLDEVMGGDDDFDTPPPTAGRRDSSKPYISKTARDLIDFLDEGPPVELKPPGMNASMISLDSSKSRSGKLQRMMSRLTLGGSSERLNGRGGSTDDMSRGAKGMRRSPSGSSSASAPPTAYLQPMNTRKPLPPVVVATPPPPLASLSLSTSSSFISMEGSMGHNSPHQANPYRRVSITRKAVPSWEDISHTVDVMPPVPAANEDPRSSPKPPKTPKASPLDAFPSVPLTVPQSPSGSGFLARSDREVVAEPQVLESIAPAAPTFGVEEAQDLRRLLSVATTADECRLLVDMFMCKAGFPLSVTPSIDPDAPKSSSTVDVAVSKLETVNDDLESSLVAFLLGGGSRDDIQD